MSMARWRSPQFVLSITLLAVLLATLIFTIEWRYKVSYSVPSELTTNDKGFRFRMDNRTCRNSKDVPGYSRGFLGECGVLEGAQLRRFKIQSKGMISGVVREASLATPFIEWLSAQMSRWENVKIISGSLWDSEFQRSSLENVVFEGVDLRGVSFRDASLTNVTFRDCKMLDMSFRRAQLKNVKFERTSCRFCDFVGTKMGSATLDTPFESAGFSFETELPFPYEQVGKYGFVLRD